MGSHSSSDPSSDDAGGGGGGGGDWRDWDRVSDDGGGLQGLGQDTLDGYSDVVETTDEVAPGAVVRRLNGDRAVVLEEGGGGEYALAAQTEDLPDETDPAVVAARWQDGNLDVEPTEVRQDWVSVVESGPEDAGDGQDAGVDVFGDAPESFADDRAGLERYREAVKQRLASEGVDVPDRVDAPPAERVSSYLAEPRADLDPQFSVRGDRAGGMPDVSFELENLRNHGGGVRDVDSGTIPETGATAYRAEYSDAMGGTSTDLFERERATYAFLDAAGVRVPRHEFEENAPGTDVAARSMSREASGPLVREMVGWDGDPETARDERLLDAVDREQAMDQMGMQLLAGNWDPHAKNVLVTDGEGAGGQAVTSGHDAAGYLVCHDLDRGASRMEKGSNHGEGFGKAKSSLQDVGFDVDRSELRTHTSGLAREMVESGDLDRVTDAVARVDPERAKTITQNVAYFALNPDAGPG